jgi:short-subunit dehydrogenase
MDKMSNQDKKSGKYEKTKIKRKSMISESSVAVVTGASSGIGQAIALELARIGMRVYGIARRLPDYFKDPAVEQKIGLGFFRPLRADVTNEPELKRVIAAVINQESRLDCLVQAAGFGIAGSVEDTTTEEARCQMDTNFFGAAYALPVAVRQMRLQGSGLIVQIGSVAGSLTIPFQAYYSASKAALAALTIALGDEVKPWGIRCMLVLPGDTRTGFTEARQLAACLAGSDYEKRCRKSISKMASDEMKGKLAAIVGQHIVRKMKRRNPPLVYTPGLFYKAVVALNRLLPERLVRWGVSLYYTGV